LAFRAYQKVIALLHDQLAAACQQHMVGRLHSMHRTLEDHR